MNIKAHARLDQLLEARLFDLDPVDGARKIQQVILALSVRRGLVAHVGADVDRGDVRVDDNGLDRVSDATTERRVR